MNTNIIALLSLALIPIISAEGVIIVLGSWTVFKDNVANVELDGNIINIYLKSPLVYDDYVTSILPITSKPQHHVEWSYDCIVISLQQGICLITLADTTIPAPKYDLLYSDKNGVLTINRKHTIPLSNINVIHALDNQLLIFLCHPIISKDGTTKTYFTLFFPTQELRQFFHDQLVLALWSGDHVKYYGE